MMVDSEKTVCADKKFDADEVGSKFSNYVFLRLVAKSRTFRRVDFRYTFFDTCYLRDCKFDSCDFTGARFLNTSLHGSRFAGCRFDYTNFEKTLVDPHILETECPGHENLKLRFARTLRTNFQQLGDARAANKAMNVEMSATAQHLRKAAWSNEAYYRSHYEGLTRAKAVAEWLEFRVLDFIWGNGENVFRLLRFVLFILIGMSAVDLIVSNLSFTFSTFAESFARSFEMLFGVLSPAAYWHGYLATITCLRLIIVSFFLAIIVKKFSRR